MKGRCALWPVATRSELIILFFYLSQDVIMRLIKHKYICCVYNVYYQTILFFFPMLFNY